MDYNHYTSNIDNQLNHLLDIATTTSHIIYPEERLKEVFKPHYRIYTPESWEQWGRNQIDDVEDGKITNTEELMKQLFLKFYNICNTGTCFQGSSKTITEDIVDMLSDKKQKQKLATSHPTSDESDPDTKKQVKLPLLTPHYNQTSDPETTKYKVDASKIWNGVTYYFFDCPTHKNKPKWYTHTAETCHT